MIGREVHFGYGKESVRGTAVAPTNWLGKLEFDWYPRTQAIRNRSGFGHIAGESGSDIVRRWGEGGITAKVMDKQMGHLLNMLCGQSPTVALASGETLVRDFTWSLLNSSAHASYTLATVEGGLSQDRYPGAMLSEFTLNIANDDYAQVEASFVSQKGTTTTGLVPAYPQELEFVPENTKLYLTTLAGNFDSAAVVAGVQEASLSISKNPSQRPSIGNDTIDPRNGVFTGELTATVFYDSKTLRNYRDNQTQLKARLELEIAGVTIGNASKPRVQFDIPYSVISDWEPDYSTDDEVTQQITLPILLNQATGAVFTAAIRSDAAAGTYA